MKLTLDAPRDLFQIKSYESGVITINDQTYQASLIVSGDSLHADWPVASLDALNTDHLSLVCDLDVKIVLLGTGRRLKFPHPSITSRLAAQGIGIEIMDTAAACRTYNVLLSEGRAVAAALILD